MKKRIRICTLLMVLLTMMVVPSYASTVNDQYFNRGPQLRFTNTSYLVSNMDINSSGKATMTTKLEGMGNDKSKVIVYLQQYKSGRWSTIKTWSESNNSFYIKSEIDYNVDSGYSYRIKVYGYVYKNGTLLETSNTLSKEVSY